MYECVSHWVYLHMYVCLSHSLLCMCVLCVCAFLHVCLSVSAHPVTTVRHLAMVLRSLTAVSGVVLFFRWSRKMGRHVGSSGLSSGPKWLKMCPLEHRSVVSSDGCTTNWSCMRPTHLSEPAPPGGGWATSAGTHTHTHTLCM